MTKFTPAFLEQIRSRVPVSKVVARHMELKRVGGRSRKLRGFSPFVKEITPSFFVEDDENRWVDFAARTRGDIFKFLMMTQGMSFEEAVTRLAQEAGLEIPKDAMH